MMEVPELQGMESSPMDLVDILWLQDVDMGAGREVFDLRLRQKENDLRRQREEKEKEQMRLLKQEEEELLQKLQLDEETGEFLPRSLPAATSVTIGTGSGTHLDTVFDPSLSFEECMDLLADSFPLEEVIQDPLPVSPSTNPAPSIPPAVSPAPVVTALLTPNRSQAKALPAPASALAPVPAPALRQPTPVSQNPMLSALLVPSHGPLNTGRIQPLPPGRCSTSVAQAPTIPQPTPLASTIPQLTPAPASGTLAPADDMEALVELLSLPELQSVNLQVSAILQQNGFSDATLPPLAENCNYNLYCAVVSEPCPQAHSTHTTAYIHPTHTLFTQSSHTHSTSGEMDQTSDGGDSRLVSDLLSQLLSSETQSDQNLLCRDAQLPIPTKDLLCTNTQLIIPIKDLLCTDTQLPIPTKDLLCTDTQLPIPTKDLVCTDTQLSIPTKDLLCSDEPLIVPTKDVHIQDTHLEIQNKDIARDADIFNKDVSMPDHSYDPQSDSRPDSRNVSLQPAEGSTEEGSYCLMELEDLALFSLEGFDTISPLGGAGDSPDSGLAVEAGFTSSPSSSSETTPSHNEEEGFVGFSESEEEEEMDINGLYSQSDAKEMSSSASLTNQVLPRDGDLIERRRHGKHPLTKDKTRRSRQTRDEQRARALNIPFPVDRIVNMAVDDFNDLVSRHQLNESQLSLVRDIRRRGKNKVAAQNCRKRKMESISGLEEELQALQDERGRLLQQRTQTQSTLSGLKQQLGSLCLEVFSLVRDEMGISYSPRDYSLQQTSDGTMFMVPRLKKSPKV